MEPHLLTSPSKMECPDPIVINSRFLIGKEIIAKDVIRLLKKSALLVAGHIFVLVVKKDKLYFNVKNKVNK
jgi:hypothetical protein